MRLAAVLFCVALWLGVPAQTKRTQTFAPVSSEVRSTAKQLIKAWIDTASPTNLDALAHRSSAFAGLVSGVDVVLDGRRMSANTAIRDCALTIIGAHTEFEDSQAIRNLVYALNEIASGRTLRTGKR